MDINQININKILSVIATWLVIFMLVSGCTTAPRSSGPMLNSAPIPSYEVGTTFVYSEGKWEFVMDTSTETVTWRDYRNYVSSGPPDFTRRRTKWETKTRSGTRQYGPRDDLIGYNNITLWPLRAGNRATYSETGTWMDKDGLSATYESQWSCEVPGTERVSVMAGEFDTWKIVCKRYYVSKSKSRSNLREVATWYYSPQVGHYVLKTSKYYYQKKSQRQELLAVLPPLKEFPAEARLKMARNFQHALEFNKRGQSVSWSYQKLKIAGDVTPVDTFKTPDDSYCRRYVQRLNLAGSHRTYYGLAVRGADGVWVVPRR
jgi:hypothetical protein